MFRPLILLALLATSCAPTHPLRPASHSSPAGSKPPSKSSSTPTPQPPAQPTLPSPPTPTALSISAQSELPLSYHNTTRDGIRMYLVSFDDRRHSLIVADQKEGTGSRWLTAQQAGTSQKGIAAINGGFFTPKGQPLGIVIESENQRGSWNHSSLGSGIYIHSATKSAIIRRQAYSKSAQSWRALHLLQTGPMLVEHARKVSGLSNNNRRARSFIAWDGRHHWAIGYAEVCTLSELSAALANRTPAGFEIKTAVNLDGGRSSDLWVSHTVPDGGHSHRGFFNKPVRNYLILKAH